jgi:hypothetical protein
MIAIRTNFPALHPIKSFFNISPLPSVFGSHYLIALRAFHGQKGLFNLFPKVHLFVPLRVAGLAKPDDVEWLVIVLMVSERSFSAAATAWGAYKQAFLNCSCNRVMTSLASRIFSSPDFVKQNSGSLSFWGFGSLSVIFPNPFKIFSSMFCNIRFCATFAFI